MTWEPLNGGIGRPTTDVPLEETTGEFAEDTDLEERITSAADPSATLLNSESPRKEGFFDKLEERGVNCIRRWPPPICTFRME